MKYLLDTNACIHVLRRRGNPAVKARVATHPSADIAVSAVSAAELYYGAERSANPAVSLPQTVAFVTQFTLLPVDDAVARAYGTIRADLVFRGLPIGPNDLLIAATAIVHNLILVTHNTKEFSRLSALTIEDWEIP